MQDLVHTMLDVFDAARDLHQTLSIKEQRDHELRLRAKGYPSSRGIEFVKDSDVSGEEAIMMDKTALKRQFETGLREIGPQFAIGDGKSWSELQRASRINKKIRSIVAYCSAVSDHRSARYSAYNFSIRADFPRPCFTAAIKARCSI
jgi:hypothetical protein